MAAGEMERAGSPTREMEARDAALAGNPRAMLGACRLDELAEQLGRTS